MSSDIAACNSVVHLIDAALQPCCTSVFEQLPQFSIVKIQPSYFDGFRRQDPPANDDGSNRRLFEEAMVDLMLVGGGDLLACRRPGQHQAWERLRASQGEWGHGGTMHHELCAAIGSRGWRVPHAGSRCCGRPGVPARSPQHSPPLPAPTAHARSS